MLSHIEIRNFQSLGHVSLELAPLTVIVGQSSSGKSALTRALNTLTSNRRGDSFITHGERVCTITATTDRGTVTLKRGKAVSDNEYTVVPSNPDIPKRAYTKLGGAVPPEVSDFIGIQAKDPINYAGQFDRPYLLDDSASEVARVLGALTNVNIVFEAARESNRRKLTHSATLKTRQADMEIIREKADTYRSLRQQVSAIERAEKILKTVHTLNRQIADLSRAIEIIEQNAKAIKQLDTILNRHVPDPETITAAHERLTRFMGTLSGIQTATMDMKAAIAKLDLLAETEEELSTRYTAMLIEAGTCPTCGQGTKELEHHHAE